MPKGVWDRSKKQMEKMGKLVREQGVMLPIEQQVCSLELSKRLKELGARQESLYYWHYSDYGMPHLENKHSEDMQSWQSVSAFTVAELGVMIPGKYIPQKFQDYWYVKSEAIRCNEADARAKTLINIIDDKLKKE